ncbi:MAG: hypothetical protein K9L26_00075 [Candidatus Izimaplasma sp.]|nr:hypothetical protein [Candidatus Izimaplasma bacterium]
MNLLVEIPSFLQPIIDGLNIEGYITEGYNFVMALSAIEQLVGALGLVIIVILGTFELIKKLSKLIIVVAVLFGLWVLYNQGFLEGIIG